jgi:hypothetical protein
MRIFYLLPCKTNLCTNYPDSVFSGFSGPSMNDYITPKEVVLILKRKGIEVTTDTVRNWCNKGLKTKRPEASCLGSIRIGGRIMVLRADLVSFLPVLAGTGT